MAEDRQTAIDLIEADFGYHEATPSHFSLAIDDSGKRFLLSPWGLRFSDLRAKPCSVSPARNPINI